MKTTNDLEIVQYTKVFNTITYELENNIKLLLNSIHIYALRDNEIVREIDFTISIHSNGNKCIRPICDLATCDSFLLAAKRVVECKKIEIKADEYWHVMKKDGSYTFYMEENANV